MRRTFKRKGAATDTVSDRIPEWRLQAEACAGLDELKAAGLAFEYAAGLEGVRLTAGQRNQAHATGMKAGEPDLRIYAPLGRVILIELKGEEGRRNAAQVKRHAALEALGFTVYTVLETTPDAMRAAVCAIVRRELGA